MVRKKNFYIYKVPVSKHREYCHTYNLSHKQQRHERYLEFKGMQDKYYRQNKEFGDIIPYKYLKSKDKPVKRRSHGLFGGSK